MKVSKNFSRNLLSIARKLVERKSREIGEGVQTHVVDTTFDLRANARKALRNFHLPYFSVPLEAVVALIGVPEKEYHWVSEYYIVGVKGTDAVVQMERGAMALSFGDLETYLWAHKNDMLKTMQHICDTHFYDLRKLRHVG